MRQDEYLAGTVEVLERDNSILREQVRTLEADNAMLARRMSEAALLVRTMAGGGAVVAQGWAAKLEPIVCASDWEHSGAALLAEMESLRAEVKRLTEERDAAKLALSDMAEALGWKGHHDSMATFVSTLRARVTELDGERMEVIAAANALEKTRADEMLVVMRDCDKARARVAELEADAAYMDARRRELNAAHILLDRANESPVQSNITERVRALLAKRETLVAERDAFRARVAELEARYAKSEKERGLAILAKQEHERAASLARDVALEEAKSLVYSRGPLGRWESEHDRLARDIDALKSQPVRRFVDAEEVRKVLVAKGSDRYGESEAQDAYTTGRNEALEDVADALGLTLDGEGTP